jgi:hypothetical protein
VRGWCARWARRLGGDYIVRGGEVILLDANKTTGSVTTYLEASELQAVRRRQADGIHAYFAGLEPL